MTFTLAQIASSFVAPALAGAGAVAVAIPVAIHILSRLRRKQEPWAAMRFILEAYRRHRTRLRLEQWLLLAVRCLLVLVVGLALAGPVVSGFAAAWTGQAGQTRTLHLVINDALAAQVRTGEATRLGALKATANRLIDGLAPGDAVAVWRASQPGEPVLAPATADHGAARQAIADLQPRHSRSAVGPVLDALARQLDAQPAVGENIVAILSDWAQGAGEVSESPPAGMEGLGDRATVLTARPAVGTANVQVAGVRPWREVVLAEALDQAVTSVQVQVARYGPDAGEVAPQVTVRARALSGAVLAEATRSLRLAAGQVSAAVNVELTIPLAGQLDGGPRLVSIEAELDQPDALPADDIRRALVELRQHLRVGVVEASTGTDATGLTPRSWMRLALAPTPGGPIEVVDLLPAAVSAAEIASLDAVIVLRPDLLPTTAWPQLEQFTRRGGIVWLMTPAQPDAAATWVRPMLETFALPWTVAMDLAATAPDAAPWPLASDLDQPEALRALSADWAALLRPLRVVRRLPVRTPDEQAWLTLNTTDEAGDVLLAEAPVGAGHVLLLATALDVEWANLVTKPAFVPLLHETLRSLAAPRGGLAVVDAGTAPDLSDAWRSTSAITRLRPTDDTDSPVAVRTIDGAISTEAPLDQPGLWGPVTGQAPLRLVVNVDAPAGDTRAVALDQLEQWLAVLGPWSYLDAADPAAALAAPTTRADLTWPLLWIALVLVLLEAALARLFSHASVAGRQTWPARLVRTVRTLRIGGSSTDASGRPTRRERAA